MNKRAIAIAAILGLVVISMAVGMAIFLLSPQMPPSQSPFVTVYNGKFVLAGKAYRFMGANFWQGMNLGVDGPEGNRVQLGKELDQLQQLGVTNLRIMASSEGPDAEPYRMTPALMTSPAVYNESVLDGLDYLLAEMGKRGLRAVMVLNNYWYWSGGMAQYVSWAQKTSIPYPGDWNAYMTYTAKFYTCTECQTWYRHHIDTIINHVNAYNGLKYRDDPAIFAWELANEPRRYPQTWVDSTATYIKFLDPNHLVTTGSEGSPPGEGQDFKATHASADIDYATIHIWPQNWGWYDPKNPATYKQAEVSARGYLQNHVKDATRLGKPLVLEEFGLARDWVPLNDIYNPSSPTTYRDQFYTAMFEALYKSASTGGPAEGVNFWAWAGQARPGNGWVGDPPHETAGWYSVYDQDATTLAIISDYAKKIASP